MKHKPELGTAQGGPSTREVWTPRSKRKEVDQRRLKELSQRKSTGKTKKGEPKAKRTPENSNKQKGWQELWDKRDVTF